MIFQQQPVQHVVLQVPVCDPADVTGGGEATVPGERELWRGGQISGRRLPTGLFGIGQNRVKGVILSL